jgi:hypothetical protein
MDSAGWDRWEDEGHGHHVHPRSDARAHGWPFVLVWASLIGVCVAFWAVFLALVL